MRREFDIRTMCILVGTAACFGLLGGAIAEQFITPIIRSGEVQVRHASYAQNTAAHLENAPETIAFQIRYDNSQE